MKSLDEYKSFEEMERDISQAEEYRELVKTYAGQIVAGMMANSNEQLNWWPETRDANRKTAIEEAHALAKAVLESLDNKEKADND